MLKQNSTIPDAELDLISRCKKGERKAQKKLYNHYRTPWFMICLRYLSTREDALDALQNALIKIYTKLEQFKPEKGQFKNWSNRIVINECIMSIRKNKSMLHVDSLEMELKIQSNDQTPIETLSAKELTNLICKLPDGYRLVFNMYVIEGFTHKEISEKLEISIGTSKSQLHKAKKLLQKQIEVLIQPTNYE